MKKILSYIAALGLVLAVLTTCESVDSSVLGGLASAGASALGASDTVAGAIGAGVGTFAESSKAARELTPENEYYIGRAVAANITTQYKVYSADPALRLYLNKICGAITVNSPRPEIWNGYHVAILDTEEINAFATSGGHIFVTRGLIACTSTEDELASVIAHEIAHIQLQHGLTAIRNSRYIKAATSGLLAGIGSAAGGNIAELADIMNESVGEIIVTLISKGYSREQEYEADSTALSLLASTGYEPSAILGMLRALERNTRGGSGFGKTHPAPADRIASVNKRLASYTVADTQTFRRGRYAAVKK
ncbi:MAG: M48 family metalloprotease [Treponema sp.]|jgi:predicted Zn-dependent protease|nr:M48 family metalloprotease [Treponema sp.]